MRRAGLSASAELLVCTASPFNDPMTIRIVDTVYLYFPRTTVSSQYRQIQTRGIISFKHGNNILREQSNHKTYAIDSSHNLLIRVSFDSLMLICLGVLRIRGAGRVSGQGGQNSAQSAENFFSVCPPWFSVCPPCHT